MAELVGKVISERYRVDEFIGRGGMAEVYKVWDQERNVHLAMKVLLADLAEDKIFLRRFRREAQNHSKLQHPNIVRFYGLEQGDGLFFLLMDFIEGTTLKKEIFQASGPLSYGRVLEVMRSVCAALYYAHKSGLVHCDVKPANIMIRGGKTVLVSDFGISRMSEAATATMVGIGTPAYMAPEQVRGENPTPQTDIYSLGVILYEMLTGGERPFVGEHARITGSTSEKVRWEQVNLEPPPMRELNPNITAELEGVVLKCLDKKPENRYGGVLELLMALEQAIAGVATPLGELEKLAEPPKVKSTQEKKDGEEKRPRARWRWASALVVVALVVVIIFSGFMFGGYLLTPTPIPTSTIVKINPTYAIWTSVAQTIAIENWIATGVALTAATTEVATNTSVPTKKNTPTATVNQQPRATTMQNANCRSGPGTMYDSIEVIYKGETVNIEGRDEMSYWYYVKSPKGIMCWLSKESATVAGNINPLQVVLAPPTPTPKPVGTNLVIFYGQTKNGEITQSTQKQVWAFWGNKGETISVVVQGNPGDLDTWIELDYPSVGAVAAKQDDALPGYWHISRVPNFLLPGTGYYYVVVSSYYYMTGYDYGEKWWNGPYTIALTKH